MTRVREDEQASESGEVAGRESIADTARDWTRSAKAWLLMQAAGVVMNWTGFADGL
jgi:hypothetical protein